MKAAKQSKLPRGLWVGRERKRAKYWSDPSVPEYYAEWRYRIRRRGLPLQMRVMPSYVLTLAQAREYARLQFQAAELVQTEELRGQITAARSRRASVVTVGQFLAAFESVALSRRLKCSARAVSSLRLVVAIAKGWLEPMSGARMNADGGRRSRQVDGLPLRDAIDGVTILAYMARVQATAGAATLDAEGRPAVNWDKNNPPLINGTINSTACSARSVFSPHSRLGAVAELNVPWDAVERFCKLSLPVAGHDVAGDIPTWDAFSKMMEGCDGLRASADAEDRELALVNELFRLLGLRSGELVMARLSWLHEGADGRCYLWVKNRPEEGWSCKTTNQAKLPLTADLAARLRGRCAAAVAEGIVNPFLILPMVPGPRMEGSGSGLPSHEAAERVALIRGRHNAWLKGFIGEVRSGQGNHRLRKFCATRIYAEELAEHHNSDKAAARVKEYLRHAKEATALIHYIAQDDERLKTVTDATLMKG